MRSLPRDLTDTFGPPSPSLRLRFSAAEGLPWLAVSIMKPAGKLNVDILALVNRLRNINNYTTKFFRTQSIRTTESHCSTSSSLLRYQLIEFKVGLPASLFCIRWKGIFFAIRLLSFLANVFWNWSSGTLKAVQRKVYRLLSCLLLLLAYLR